MSPPPGQIALAEKYGKQFGVDPKLLLAIGGHETQWGAAGAGRPSQGGYVLGYGVEDNKTLSKYAGVESQYRYAASTLASWGVHSIGDVMAGKASRYASDPAWEKGVASVYSGLGGALPQIAAGSSNGRTSGPDPGGGGSTPSPAAIPGQMSPVDYRRQAAQQALAGIAMGKKPTDMLQGTVDAMQAMPQTLPQAPRTPQGVQAGKSIEHGSALGQAIVASAKQELGQKYVWGGESEKEGGFDCSGLVDYAMRQHGYTGGRITTETIKSMGHSVKGGVLAPGDLVLANHGEHVVIYAGNGQVIAAPHTGAVVRFQPLSDFNITDVRRPY